MASHGNVIILSQSSEWAENLTSAGDKLVIVDFYLQLGVALVNELHRNSRNFQKPIAM
eukprot:TRINITY_DN11929_c0_g1_i1.p1 TRINITY_DN11929_c0_g1~~TRINITY_DN11929_c0_g1_i1.p1  ORF type:complete len:58 (+),score=3.81 TRINITY_DN11929_c0_g1_i1:141-314(+)